MEDEGKLLGIKEGRERVKKEEEGGVRDGD